MGPDISQNGIIELARLVADFNEKIISNTNNTQDCLGFPWKEYCITNPLMDETERFEVNPIEYYGSDFLVFIEEVKEKKML